MCFAPQRRATFHLSSFLIWPHGSAPAALASVLFESFRHSGATNHYNNKVFHDFPNLFAQLYLLSSYSFSSDLLSSFLLFSDSSHLCFSSIHIVRSLTSKLPLSVFCVSLLWNKSWFSQLWPFIISYNLLFLWDTTFYKWCIVSTYNWYFGP